VLIVSPLRVPVTKTKYFALNLNGYRNEFYHSLNKAKVEYKKTISNQLLALPKLSVIEISYTYYPKTKRRCDLDNVCSVTAKFFQDALVETGLLEDDDYLHIPKTTFLFGSVDKLNPRIDIRITNYANTT